MATLLEIPNRQNSSVSPLSATQVGDLRSSTILTADCEFKGALAFSGQLQLHGKLEGTIESDGGTLIVGHEASIHADIRVSNVLIFGRVRGSILATGRVELRGKAEVYGDVRSNRLAIDDGVVFVGRSELIDSKGRSSDFSRMFKKLENAAVRELDLRTAKPMIAEILQTHSELFKKLAK